MNKIVSKSEVGLNNIHRRKMPYLDDLLKSSPKEKVDSDTLKKPDTGLKKLKYVFGYSKDNIFYTEHKNQIVYRTAAVGIVLDTKTNTQKFFTNHKHDISSIAMHPNGHTVATGEKSPKGKIKMIQ